MTSPTAGFPTALKRSRWLVILGGMVATGGILLLIVGRGDKASDLLVHPELLLKTDFHPDSVNVGGVKMGDPKSAVAAGRIKVRKHDAVFCTDGAVYAFTDDRVTLMGIDGVAVLSKV